MTRKLSIIGSGNWGSVVANIAARNIVKMPGFDHKVNMWVFDEKVEGQSLVEIINTRHENVKYLPGVTLPENLHANPDLVACAKDADFLVFILPHQFIEKTCATIKPVIKKTALGVSFIKGVFCSADGIELISDRIKSLLDIPVSVVMGANVANEIAQGKFAEATLGFDSSAVGLEDVKTMQRIFSLPTLPITPVNDVVGVEISGALKNVVALAAGFVDGLDLGSNTKSAILRLGMIEIQKFAFEFFAGRGVRADTFWQSSGFADLITTCYAGRNRKCAEMFVRSGKDWDYIEKCQLNGQKLQGHLTCAEIFEFLRGRGKLEEYKLFHQIYRISFEENGAPRAHPSTVVTCFTGGDLPAVISSKQ